MAANWQTDHASAVSQAQIWIGQVAEANDWTAEQLGTALEAVDEAAASSDPWYWSGDAQEFWTVLSGLWAVSMVGVPGAADLENVWNAAYGAAGSASEEGLQVDDLTEIAANPDADPNAAPWYQQIPGWVAPVVVGSVVAVIVLRATR